MRSFCLRLLLGVLSFGVLPIVASAGTTTPFGPSVYLQTGDTPSSFYCATCPEPLHIEDFEDDNLDPFLTINHGSIFPPNSTSGTNQAFTDSVDGDDGSIDGSGLNGYSWFTGNFNSVTVDFANTVSSAGLVFTDGDLASTNVVLEAFDMGGASLGIINAGDLADGVYSGETAEDRFLGFHNDMGSIASITLSINAGSGIEIDHIQWQAVPEPTSAALGIMSILGLCGLRRRRN